MRWAWGAIFEPECQRLHAWPSPDRLSFHSPHGTTGQSVLCSRPPLARRLCGFLVSILFRVRTLFVSACSRTARCKGLSVGLDERLRGLHTIHTASHVSFTAPVYPGRCHGRPAPGRDIPQFWPGHVLDPRYRQHALEPATVRSTIALLRHVAG